jgi:hypothetical protein
MNVFLIKGCPGWGANPGPLDFIYFLIFTTLRLSHSGSPQQMNGLLGKANSILTLHPATIFATVS